MITNYFTFIYTCIFVDLAHFHLTGIGHWTHPIIIYKSLSLQNMRKNFGTNEIKKLFTSDNIIQTGDNIIQTKNSYFTNTKYL